MLAAQFRNTGGVPGPEQLCKSAMFFLRPPQFTFLYGQDANQRRYRIPQQIDLPPQMLAVATLIQAGVKSKIKLRPDFKADGTLERCIQRAHNRVERIGVGHAAILGRERACARLQHRSHIEDVFDLVGIQRRDKEAAARLELNEPFGRQAIERLPHRQSADA